MKKQSIFGLFALVLVLLVSACKKNGFDTTESGLKFKYIIKSDTGEVAGEGGYLDMHIRMMGHMDSLNIDTVLTDTYKDGFGTAKMLVAKPTYSGCINEGFAMLKAGDSVIFKVRADSLYTKTFSRPTPDIFKGPEELTVMVKVLASKSKTTFEKEQKDNAEKQAKALQETLKKEGAELQKAAADMGYGDKLEISASGLYFAKIKTTNGPTAKPGDVGSFFYKGMFVDGKEFESNFGGEPFNVTIGAGGAIAGWLEVVDKIKLGERWILFIPSSLAYGENGSGSIPPNTPLIFEMELGKIRTAEQVKKDEEERMKKLSGEEPKKISNYIKGKNFTKAGDKEIYYTIINEGTGAVPAMGDKMKVKIKGFDLNDKPIPSFTMVEPPIDAVFATGSFPPAMEFILAKLKNGGKAKVVSSSANFQGAQGGGQVPPYTPIMFEIELVSLEKSK